MPAQPLSFNRPAIIALATAQTIVWAFLYYVFPALFITWEQELGWSKTALAGAFTAAQVTAALAAPFMGRLIDRNQGRRVLMGGSAFGCILLVLLSQVTALWQFYVIWVLMGIAFAGSLYEPCFAYLTKYLARNTKRAITMVTLIAGFASALSFPSAQFLTDLFGWRITVLVFSAGVAFVAVPLMWMGTRISDVPAGEAIAPMGTGTPLEMSRVFASPVFWLLALAYALTVLEHGMLLTHMLPIFDERTIPKETAIIAASLLGPMQVVGRLIMMAFERHASVVVTMSTCFVFLIAACIVLLASAATPGLVFVFVMLQGAGWGVTSIARPVTTAAYLGREGFGTISGAIAVPTMITMAAAPTVAAFIWRLGGYDMVIMVGLFAAVAGLIAFIVASRFAAKTGENGP